jgi:MFS family permease
MVERDEVLSAEDDVEPVEPNNSCAILSVLAVLSAPLLFGIIIGSTGPSLDTMRNEVRSHQNDILKLPEPNKLVVFTAGQAALYSSLVSVGAIVGGLVSGSLSDSIGFKGSMWVTVPIFLISWLAMGYSEEVWLLLLARVCTGIGVGINSSVVPTYINEISPDSLRGLLGASHQLSITLGILLVYFLGMLFKVSGGSSYPISETMSPDLQEVAMLTVTEGILREPRLLEAPPNSFCNWRALSLFNIVPTVVLCVSIVFIPESPRWLAVRGRLDEAFQALNTLRGGVYSEEDSVALFKISPISKDQKMKEQQPVTFWDLGKINKQMLIAILLQFFQQFSGINAVMFYCTTIMRKAKVHHADSISVTVMFEQVIITAIACVLMDKVGRRFLLITGASVMAAACFMFGLYFALDEAGNRGMISLVFISVYSYMAAFSIGVGAIPWLIIGEIIPPKLRSIGASVATTFNWICCFVVTIGFEAAAKTISDEGVMWCFGVCCIGMALYTGFCVPETKGKSFAEIQEHFNGPSTVRNHPKKSASSDERQSLI